MAPSVDLMAQEAGKFYGNDPGDIWDEGFLAAQAGRSMGSNPFRTGEAERQHRLGQQLAASNGDLPDEAAGSFWTPDED